MTAPLIRALRAEQLKSRHAAPKRLAIVMALPFPLLAFFLVFANPMLGTSFSPWNYWYALMLPVSLSLITACVARADTRLSHRALLSCGMPLDTLWWAKALWCLALSTLANLVVLGIYLLCTWGAAAWGHVTTDPSALAMAGAALTNIVLSAWMIPLGLLLTSRAGMLAGIFIPLVVSIGCGFAWSLVPFWQLLPPVAAMIVPSALIPVLPSGEPMSAASESLAAALGTFGASQAVALAAGIVVFVALTALGAAWFKRSEEL